MGLEYLQLFADMESLFEPYDDAERGRLMMAMMAYAYRGEEPRFAGNERFIWPVLRQHIDRCAASVEKQKANGSKGGRPPKNKTEENPAKPEETHRNPKKPKETQRNHNQDHDQEQDHSHDHSQNHVQESYSDQPSVSEYKSACELTDDELLEIRKERADVEDAARRVGLPVSALADQNCMDTLRAEHGAGNVLRALERMEGAAEKSRNWRYVAGILRSEKAQGYAWREKPPDGKEPMQRHGYTSADFKAMVTDLDADDSGRPKGKDGDIMQRYTPRERKATYSAAVVDFDGEG